MGTVTQLFKNKKTPESRLDDVKHTLVLGLSAIMLFTLEGTPPMLQNSSCCFGRHTISFDDIISCLNDPKEKSLVLDHFTNMLYRNFIHEAVFIVEDHCHKAGKNDLLHKQEWYPFARVMKDCFCNGFRLNVDDIVDVSFPIKWRHKVITEDMRGGAIHSTFFDFDDAWDLVEEMRRFILSLQ